MEIREKIVTVDTTGEAGAATGSGASQEINGVLESIYIDYHADAPATTDVTIAFGTRGGNIVVATSTRTATLYVPVKQACGADGAVIAGEYVKHILNQAISVSVAQCDELTSAVTVYLRYSQ